ncbi:hypothetical protein P4S72_18255 [Vibrio sp. PP-XX7]
MTIITLKQQLSQMVNPDFILKTAKQVGFTQRNLTGTGTTFKR